MILLESSALVNSIMIDDADFVGDILVSHPMYLIVALRMNGLLSCNGVSSGSRFSALIGIYYYSFPSGMTIPLASRLGTTYNLMHSQRHSQRLSVEAPHFKAQD